MHRYISVSFRPFFYIIIACLTMNQNEFSIIEEVIYVHAFTAEFLPFYEYVLFFVIKLCPPHTRLDKQNISA